MSKDESVLDYREPEWVAKKLGLDKNTIYKYLQEGWLPGLQLGRKWLISERLLAEHLERMTRLQTLNRSGGGPPQTPRLHRAIELAQAYAAKRGQDFTGTEHLLIGLMREGGNVAVMVLKGLGVEPDRAEQLFEQRVPATGQKVAGSALTERAQATLRAAREQATQLGFDFVGCESLLLALLLDQEGLAFTLLQELGITHEAARAEVIGLTSPAKP